jgi:hypothetical protein
MAKKICHRKFIFEKPVSTRIDLYKWEKDLIARAALAEGMGIGAFMVKASLIRAGHTKEDGRGRIRKTAGAAAGVSQEISNVHAVPGMSVGIPEDRRCPGCRRDNKQFCGKCMTEVLRAQA